MVDSSDSPDMGTSTVAWQQAQPPLAPASTTEADRKTVRFGDHTTVVGGKVWSLVSVLILALLWIVVSWLQLVPDLFWPSPLEVWSRFVLILTDGYRGFTLAEHLWASIFRVLMGFALGCLLGIPVGFSMGLSKIARGLFDPIIEFYRPIPPLALLPLIIIWMGIDDSAKICVLFLAAFSIMVIASRAGVSAVKLSKIHAAYSLGASKWQILRYVIFPNALPDIFIGMRVAMGVCWGTVVAAEMIAADRGVGFMVMVASKYMMTDLVVLGVIVMGLIGYLIDLVMRSVEAKLVPWKGKG